MIKLNHGYQIEADERCYILSRTTKGRNKKGEETEYKRAVGYYSRLNTAISAYADELERQHIQDTDMTLAEAITAVTEIREGVKKLIREAMPEVVGK